MNKLTNLVIIVLVVAFSLQLTSCKKIKKFRDENPDLVVLEQGFKSSAAMGYCASLAHMAASGNKLPANVIFKPNSNSEYSNAGILYVNVSEQYPVPFNSNFGDIVIAMLWDGEDRTGVMSILLADIDLINADFRFYGLHTIPFIEEGGTGDIITVFAQQDIIVGEGQDTIINLSMSRPQFNLEADRANGVPPSDPFVAVKQNVWFVKVDQNDTYSDIYDDIYEISGGGQMAEASGDEGGIQYHALINTRFNYLHCGRNPYSGTGFIQNLKAGDGVDLGNITLDFHDVCDGQAYVNVATGKYLPYVRRDVNLNFE